MIPSLHQSSKRKKSKADPLSANCFRISCPQTWMTTQKKLPTTAKKCHKILDCTDCTEERLRLWPLQDEKVCAMTACIAIDGMQSFVIDLNSGSFLKLATQTWQASLANLGDTFLMRSHFSTSTTERWTSDVPGNKETFPSYISIAVGLGSDLTASSAC